jgi:hypothetical protein
MHDLKLKPEESFIYIFIVWINPIFFKKNLRISCYHIFASIIDVTPMRCAKIPSCKWCDIPYTLIFSSGVAIVEPANDTRTTISKTFSLFKTWTHQKIGKNYILWIFLVILKSIVDLSNINLQMVEVRGACI